MSDKEKMGKLIAQAENLGTELSEDELDEVSGGGVCACFGNGGGSFGARDRPCTCVVGGQGYYEDPTPELPGRCYCPFVGGGLSKDK